MVGGPSGVLPPVFNLPVPISARSTALALGLAAALALSLTSASRAADPSLYANYTASCTFAFVTDSGGPVTSVPPGTYQIVVFTPFAFGNGTASCEFVQFHLTGPGVNLETDLGGGDAEYEQHTVTLQANGTYTVQDDGRPTQTRRTFTVASSGPATSSGGTPPTSTTSSPSSPTSKGTPSVDPVGSATRPFRGALDAAVSKSGKLTLERAGTSVSSIRSGRYTLRVADASHAAGFAVRLIKHSPTIISTRTFTGSRKVTIALAPGQWFFYTPGGATHPFFVIR
jgi:hypothetical protein